MITALWDSHLTYRLINLFKRCLDIYCSVVHTRKLAFAEFSCHLLYASYISFVYSLPFQHVSKHPGKGESYMSCFHSIPVLCTLAILGMITLDSLECWVTWICWSGSCCMDDLFDQGTCVAQGLLFLFLLKQKLCILSKYPAYTVYKYFFCVFFLELEVHRKHFWATQTSGAKQCHMKIPKSLLALSFTKWDNKYISFFIGL